MQIFIKFEKTHALKVERSDTVEHLKERFIDVIGVPFESVNLGLRYQGRLLEDDRTLEHYGVNEHCTLRCDVIIRSRQESSDATRQESSDALVFAVTSLCPDVSLKQSILTVRTHWTAAELNCRLCDLIQQDVRATDLLVTIQGFQFVEESFIKFLKRFPFIPKAIEIDVRLIKFEVRVPKLFSQEPLTLSVFPTRTLDSFKKQVCKLVCPEAAAGDFVLEVFDGTNRTMPSVDDAIDAFRMHTFSLKFSPRLEWLEKRVKRTSIKLQTIVAGSILVAKTRVQIFESTPKLQLLSLLLPGQRVIAMDSPEVGACVKKRYGGRNNMIRIHPVGAVEAEHVELFSSQVLPAELARQLLSSLPHCNRYTQYKVSKLDSASSEFLILEGYLRSSLVGHRRSLKCKDTCSAPQIILDAIERVFNPRLLEKFILELQHMNGLSRHSNSSNMDIVQAMKLLPTFEADLNEVFLYHGANDSDVDLICQSGFDTRRAGQTSGRLFGRGTYFAENFSKADLYSGPRPFVKHGGQMSVIVARVALGEMFTSNESMPEIFLPPDRPGSRIPFDSVVASKRSEGGCVDHREYIVYKDVQALPVYRILYHHAEGCPCARCLAG